MRCLSKSCSYRKALLSEGEKHLAGDALADRLEAKRAFNPMSLKRLQEEKYEWDWYMMDELDQEHRVLSTGRMGGVRGNGGPISMAFLESALPSTKDTWTNSETRILSKESK